LINEKSIETTCFSKISVCSSLTIASAEASTISSNSSISPTVNNLNRHANRDAMPGVVHYGLLPPQEAIYNTELPSNCARLQLLSKTLPNCAYMSDAEVESIIKAIKAVA
jgi:hypothetical protein